MSIHRVPTNVFKSRIVTIDQKQMPIILPVNTELVLYIYIELGLIWLEQGTFIFEFVKDDATIGMHSYDFRGLDYSSDLSICPI